MNSPIRYFGGKGGMYPKILSEFPVGFGLNKVQTSNQGEETYIEPFGGSASILFHKSPSPIEIYNDLDRNVYSLFYVLANKNMFQQFKEKCDVIYFSRQMFEEYSISLRKDVLSPLERAFRFFYVNRVAYNGVGGFSCIVNCVRRGMSKTISDMLSSIERLPEIHQRLSSVIIENKKAIDLLKDHDRPNVFFYLDPPYHHSTRANARYDIDMTNEEQEILIKSLLKVKKAKVLISGYRCKLYNQLSKGGWRRVDFDVKTQDGNRQSVGKKESLWRNYKRR